jgi:MFS family permease
MKQQLRIKFALLAASTMTIMAGAIVAPSLPMIAAAFAENAHIALLSRLVITLPALLIVLFSSIAGWSIDRFGRKVMMLGSLIFYALAGTTGVWVQGIEGLLIGRAFLGIAVAGNMVAITTLIADFFKGQERNNFIGFQGSFMAFGGVLFILSAGLLAEISWRMPFWLYALSIPVVMIVWKNIPEPTIQRRGFIKLSGGKQRINRKTAAFIYLMGFTGMALFYIIPAQLPFLLKEVHSATNSMIGYAISLSTLSGALVALGYGAVRKRLSFQWIYAVAFMLFAIGYSLIAKAMHFEMVLAGLVIAGAGTGLLMPNANLWMLSIAPEMNRGRMVGNLTMAVFLGQFVSPLLAHPMMAAAGIRSVFLYPSILMLFIALAFVAERLLSHRFDVKHS